MSRRSRQDLIDYSTLAEYLVALGYPVRLEILHQLRFPHTLSELKISSHREFKGAQAERPLARQTVQWHLDKLVEAGLVRIEETEQHGRKVPVYSTKPSRLYALAEDMRRLTTLYAGISRGTDPTGTMQAYAGMAAVEGPHLRLVHGVYEGKSFPLTKETAEENGWFIGRQKGIAVSLDYDPFVSGRNSFIAQDRKAFVIHDAPESKNGTMVNWALLPEGGSQELKSGDVIGVGRSLLCFIAD